MMVKTKKKEREREREVLINPFCFWVDGGFFDF